ncbi:minor capsid protein [Spongiactinospora sp. TRM90649]|uniref:minor capsid protein n=1 Tax=Spongiactinospora sp. TRM90649 TaxID=3031114 RepID=UPI0023FA2EAB|nr:minor capsid protein [Spongiactinospora sp. TRM90649]MDF5756659.1 minor capsid protein [Spongiactinospora sp. TRM90649]
MAFSRDLLTGLAEFLAAHDVADWNEDGYYASGQVALTIGGLPPSPDRAISLAVYGAGREGDHATQADSVMQVQARIRGGTDPRLTDDLADAVFDRLHGLSEVELPTGIWLYQAQRRIVAPLDRDSSGRWGRADSYELSVLRPSSHRR